MYKTEVKFGTKDWKQWSLMKASIFL